VSDSGRESNPNHLLSTMDATVWAKEFCECTKFTDESWALSWMANAIMTGYDFGIRKAAQRASDAGFEDAAEAIMPGWKLLRELERQ
jgi:hypothetical protein